MLRTREELELIKIEIEQGRQALEARRKAWQRKQEKPQEQAAEGADPDSESLRRENARLKRYCDALKLDHDRVYAGHKALEEEINFLQYRILTLDKLYESVVWKTGVHDGTFEKYKCLHPFERIEILPRGEVYTCCSAYLKHGYYIGNIYEQSFDEIWNSERALKLRYSVSNGNFEYCMENCKWMHEVDIGDKADPEGKSPIKERTQEDYVDSWEACRLDVMPRFIALTCDETCNLTCPTCRSAAKALKKDESEALYERLMAVVRPMLRDCEQLEALGSGDIFASYALTKFYKTLTAEEFPKLKLYIITNLQLLTPKKWNEMDNLHDIPIKLSVSVDAADKETYEKNRRGGDWETLRTNLSFIRKWRKRPDSKIESLCLHFVVQENNFRQIEDFVSFGEKYGADTIEFQRLTNWGTFSEEEFLRRNVMDPGHELYGEACSKIRAVMSKEWKLQIIQNIL